MFPDTLHIGPLPIHIFGVMLALAFLAGAQVLQREFGRKGFDPDLASSVIVWAAVGSLVGARVWLVLEDWPSFVRDPIGFLFTGSGFVFYGGLVGGALAVTLLFRRSGIPWWQGADAAAPALVLGQAIGRVGCQLSGDGDWGAVTTVPWGAQYPYAVVCGIPPARCGADGQTVWPSDVWVHPTPVYETLAYLAVFVFLWRRRREPHPDGSQIAWYLILASGARFAVEFWRINPVAALGLTAAQWTSLGLIALGTAQLLRLQRRWRTVAA